jgi:hypothetical protein
MKLLPSLGPTFPCWSHAQLLRVSGYRVIISKAPSSVSHAPKSNHLGWKGLVMLRAMHALLAVNAFCSPNNPGPTADYTHADPTDLTLLTRTEQASIDTMFAREKHYYHSMKTSSAHVSPHLMQASTMPSKYLTT